MRHQGLLTLTLLLILNIIDLLLTYQKTISVNDQGPQFFTPLIFAAADGAIDIIKLLLDHPNIDFLLTFFTLFFYCVKDATTGATYYRNAVYIELLAQRSGLSSSDQNAPQSWQCPFCDHNAKAALLSGGTSSVTMRRSPTNQVSPPRSGRWDGHEHLLSVGRCEGER
ncbi:hypothetical protein N7467_003076 [Penicillium canescens]|nr:hypothetical protein N7467_003076 [Penicillium canescens]